MKKEFVPYELAVKLKVLGFDEPCVAIFGRNNELSVDDGFYKQENYHKDTILAPTFSQAFRWFREKHSDLDFGVAKIHNGTTNYHYHINLQWEFFEGTYEEAELACLDKLLEIVEFKSE